jgi:hypothetical protein
MYKLVITKIEPNPKYDADFTEKTRRISSYGYNGVSQDEIDKTRELDFTEVLKVELTDEEYKAFKKAALEIK